MAKTLVYMDGDTRFVLTEGAHYLYNSALPAGCEGHLYRIIKMVVYEPVRQKMVLAEALTGPDRGTWFVCNINNFCKRYSGPISDEDAFKLMDPTPATVATE